MSEIEVAKPGDVVVVFLGPQALSQIVLTPNSVFDNRYGKFAHNDIIGKPLGHKVKSLNSNGFLHCLEPTPELWTLSLPHRTQIIYFVDISVILLHLNVKPGHRVVESGTGSGSLTTSLARAVGPMGHVFTFEFNADRVDKAREDFAKQKMSDRVTVTHADACVDGFGDDKVNSIDAVFLDLPQPWEAIPHAKKVLHRNGTICCFSPCIEQVQRNCDTLSKLGFEDVHTVEALGRYYDIQSGRLPPAPIDFSSERVEMLLKSGGVVEEERVSGKKRPRPEVKTPVAAETSATAASVTPSAPATAPVASDEPTTTTTTTTTIATTTDATTPPFGTPLPESALKVLPTGVTQVLTTRGHTSYLTFATLYRKT